MARAKFGEDWFGLSSLVCETGIVCSVPVGKVTGNESRYTFFLWVEREGGRDGFRDLWETEGKTDLSAGDCVTLTGYRVAEPVETVDGRQFILWRNVAKHCTRMTNMVPKAFQLAREAERYADGEIL